MQHLKQNGKINNPCVNGTQPLCHISADSAFLAQWDSLALACDQVLQRMLLKTSRATEN